jgi:hypothetical protein
VKSLVMVCASLVASLGGAELAAADALPAWCRGKALDAGTYDLNELKRSEPENVVKAIAKTMCTPAPEISQHHAKIEVARQAWGKKLGMNDADWADAVELLDNRDGNYPKIALSAKLLAQFSPMDQYRLIADSIGGNGGLGGINEPFYAADTLGSQLTEVGRLAFLQFCAMEDLNHSSVGRWAACQGDVDAWDFAKFATQLRSDTAHDGATKMLLRFRALNLDETLKDYAAERDKLFKQDDAYKKVFEVAARGRLAWAKGIGTNTKLLELVQTMESAKIAGSRKMFADCEAKTAESLVTAVATIPAKAFTGMVDDRMEPTTGFAYQASPVLLANPQVQLAAIAYVLCQPQTSTADWLAAGLDDLPGMRGPRNAATTEIHNEKWVFDDVNARKLDLPKLGGRPYDRTGGSIMSHGGVIASVKVVKDVATISMKKTSVMSTECVKSHYTNRLTRILPDGSLQYELICDKWMPKKYDTTPSDLTVHARFAPMLKPGMQFSALRGAKEMEVIATWATAKATAPATILGAKLK